MGLGFALWSETLNVAAAVNTDNLDVAFADAVADDNEDGSHDDAQCTTAIDGGNLKVTLTNAYPGYSCEIATKITNSGTVDAVATYKQDPASVPDSNSKITITRTGGATVYPDGATTAGPTYTVAVHRSATKTDVAESNSYTISASIDFENDTP
jgi:hypothetical protein